MRRELSFNNKVGVALNVIETYGSKKMYTKLPIFKHKILQSVLKI